MKAIFNHLLHRSFALLLQRMDLLCLQHHLIEEWVVHPRRRSRYEQQISDLVYALQDNQEEVCNMLLIASCVKPKRVTKEQEKIGEMLHRALKISISDYKEMSQLAMEFGMNDRMKEEIISTLHIGAPG